MRVRTDILSTDLLGGCAPASANADYITRPEAVENASARYAELTLQPQGEDRAGGQIHVFTELGGQRAPSAEDGPDDGALGAADHLADHAPEHRADSRALGVVALEIDFLLDGDDAGPQVLARPVIGIDRIEPEVQPAALDRPLAALHAADDAAYSSAGGQDDTAVELDGQGHRRFHAVFDLGGLGGKRLLQAHLDLRPLGKRAGPGEAPVERVVDVALQAGDRLPQLLHLTAGGAEDGGPAALAAADLHLEVRHLVPDVVGPVLEFLVARMAGREGGQAVVQVLQVVLQTLDVLSGGGLGALCSRGPGDDQGEAQAEGQGRKLCHGRSSSGHGPPLIGGSFSSR